jgi:hypothetical protein
MVPLAGPSAAPVLATVRIYAPFFVLAPPLAAPVRESAAAAESDHEGAGVSAALCGGAEAMLRRPDAVLVCTHVAERVA